MFHRAMLYRKHSLERDDVVLNDPVCLIRLNSSVKNLIRRDWTTLHFCTSGYLVMIHLFPWRYDKSDTHRKS